MKGSASKTLSVFAISFFCGIFWLTSVSAATLETEADELKSPARQVLIEARIVDVDTTYEEEMGLRFGVSNSAALSGEVHGANWLSQADSVDLITPLEDRLNFNVPAAKLFDGSTPGDVGLALTKLGHLFLDLELSALEGEHHAQVVSRPRIITANQQKAIIQTGEVMPYQESASSAATSVAVKTAALSLEIVPKIMPDNQIMLNLKAMQDSRGDDIQLSDNTSPTTNPVTNSQEVESNVLLSNNETIVIGGVYRDDKRNGLNRVPFFGSSPMMGFLFRHTSEYNEKHELLIFITPKIITVGSNGTVHTASAKNVNSKLYNDEGEL